MKYRRAKHTAWRTIADETIILDLSAKRMVGLNPTAAFIWLSLETFEDLQTMLAALGGDAADSPIETADLERFLQELLTAGLIESEEPEERRPVAVDRPPSLEPPKIEWQETLEQVAMSCAFFPAQNPLCNQVPFS